MTSFRQYWHVYLWRDVTSRLITVCFLVWAVIGLLSLIDTTAAYTAVAWLAEPAVPAALLTRPWTVLTYMFVHVNFIHLIINMMWLMMFGRIMYHTEGGERTLAMYIYGGIAGALSFLAFNAAAGPTHSMLLGASCAIIGLIGAITVAMPSLKVNLMFFGAVNVGWIGVLAILFFVIMAPSTAESVAHAGGFAVGAAYGLLRRRGIDITRPMRHLLGYFHSPATAFSRRKPTTTNLRGTDADVLDRLLEKVSRSGYRSLSSVERQTLFDLTQRMK